MDAVNTMLPHNQTNITGGQIFLKIIAGPKRENILRATSMPDCTRRQINSFIVKFKNIPIRVGVSFDGFRYDRYSNDHIIVNGEIVDFQILVNPNKRVRKILQQAKAFCLQVQLRYNCCTCDSGKIVLHHVAA